VRMGNLKPERIESMDMVVVGVVIWIEDKEHHSPAQWLGHLSGHTEILSAHQHEGCSAVTLRRQIDQTGRKPVLFKLFF